MRDDSSDQNGSSVVVKVVNFWIYFEHRTNQNFMMEDF